MVLPPHPPRVNNPLNTWRPLKVCRCLQQAAAAAAQGCVGPISEGVSATALVLLLLLFHSMQFLESNGMLHVQPAVFQCVSAKPACSKFSHKGVGMNHMSISMQAIYAHI